jgi:hypothetical protein
MNCFNIRELQGILKRKFFNDLVNTNDHRELLNNSIVNLRYKVNSNNLIENDMLMFYNYGLTFSLKNKENNLENNFFTSKFNNFNFNYMFSYLNDFYKNNFNFHSYTNLYNNMFELNFSLIKSFNFTSLLSLPSVLTSIKDVIFFNFNNISIFLEKFFINFSFFKKYNTVYKSENIETVSPINNYSSELSNSARFNRFSNPIISYDYKCGHYLGI